MTSSSRPQVLVVAAPFGFGPAAKALVLAHALQHELTLTLCGSGESQAFLQRHAPDGVAVVGGRFSECYPDGAALATFDAVLSINHAPALQHLSRQGLAGRSIFVDSLLPWRLASDADGVPPGLLAHVVQDYPGAASLLQGRAASHAWITGPILWPVTPRLVSAPRGGVVLHLGGMTSPLAPWASIASAVGRLVRQVVAAVAPHDVELTLLGSPHLAELDLAGARVTVCTEASPDAAAHRIASADLLITTPGIGAVFEALSQDTPLLLLPPMNSTQLHHHQVLVARGLRAVMPAALSTRLAAAARTVDWPQQTRLCLQGLLHGSDALLAELPAQVWTWMQARHDPARRDPLMQGQRAVQAGLSRVDPVATLRTLIGQACAVPRPATPPQQGAPARVGRAAAPDDADATLRAQLRALPKVELHVHLEGSLPPEFLLALARRNRVKLPFDTPQAFHARRRYRDFRDFAQLLMQGAACLRTPEDFHDAVAVVGTQMLRQNIRYAEITWTPQLYGRTGLSPDAILAAMNVARDALQRRSGLQLRWIPDIVRSHPGVAQAVAEWASSAGARAAGVVALGLGGPEAGYPADPLAAAFQLARDRGLPANPHAGEGVGADKIWRTLHALQPVRIGHGVSAADDPALMAELASRDIHLEVCPTSNVQLGLYPSLAAHPVKRLIDAGCSVSLNTDDPVMFGTTLNREYLRAIRQCGLDLATVQRCILSAALASHLPAAEKQALLDDLRCERADGTAPAGTVPASP